MRSRPVFRRRDSSWLVLLPSFRNVGCERIIWIWGAEESLDGEEDGSNLEGWGPVACAHRLAHIKQILDVNLLLSTSKQMRPSLSMFGW